MQSSKVQDQMSERHDFLAAARERYRAGSPEQKWTRIEEIEERMRDLGRKGALWISELGEYVALQEERDALLHPRDPRHTRGFVFDDEHNTVDVWWGGYEYSIKLTEITTPMDILKWISHVGGKGWRGMTGTRVGEFVDAIARRKRWDIHQSHGHLPKRTNEHSEERGKLTPQLRYRVLERDDFRCRTCGNGPEQGAVLHIDHVLPISKGGSTTFDNLQALCSSCNLGKGANTCRK